MRDVPRTRGCSLPSTMLAHIPGPSAKPSSNTTPMSGRETSHSSQYPRKKHVDVAPKFELPNSHQLPSSKHTKKMETHGNPIGKCDFTGGYHHVSSVSSKEPSIQHRLEGSLHDVPTRPSRVVCEPPSWAHGGILSAQLHSRQIKMEISLLYVDLCGFMWNYVDSNSDSFKFLGLGVWPEIQKQKQQPGGVNDVNVGPRCGVPWVRPLKVWSFPQGTSSANLASANSSPVEVGVIYPLVN